nr:CinA family protein [Brumimicrobium salinarum]
MYRWRNCKCIYSISRNIFVFLGGLITYANDLKMSLANVPEKILQKHGAVSEQTAKAMAEGGRLKLNTDYTIAVTGIAGPDGGTKEKPVGTVWIALAGPHRTIAKVFHFGNHRGRNIEKTMLYAANLIRKEILEIA